MYRIWTFQRDVDAGYTVGGVDEHSRTSFTVFCLYFQYFTQNIISKRKLGIMMTLKYAL